MVDREMQREILKFLYAMYPDSAQPFKMPRNKDKHFRFNLFYLHGHGLVGGKKSTECGDREFLHVTITPKGIDFLSDDGGLGAVLGVVTVKLHSESIAALIEANLVNAPISKEEKGILMDAIRKTPATLLTETLKQLVSLGISQAPHGYQTLQNMILG